jgi:hypothetical protein
VRRLRLISLLAGVAFTAWTDFGAAQEITGPPKAAPPPAAMKSAQPTPPSPSPPASTASTPSASAQGPTAIEPATDEPPAVVSKAAPPKAPEAPKPPPEPLKRPRFNAAIMQGVDKITAETLRFEAKVGEPVRYKGLILTVHACETTAADEDITDSIAHVEVQSQPEVLPGRAAAPPRQVFKGWMFASSPTLHPFEHSVYDLWLIACKTTGPGA